MLWQAAWQHELALMSQSVPAALSDSTGRQKWATTSSSGQVLVMRLDIAFWQPEALGQQLASIHSDAHARDKGALWVAHPWAPNCFGADCGGMRGSLACIGYARDPRVTAARNELHARTPLLADAVHWVPARHAGLMGAVFPGHDTTDCLIEHGVDLRFLSSLPANSETSICANEVNGVGNVGIVGNVGDGETSICANEVSRRARWLCARPHRQMSIDVHTCGHSPRAVCCVGARRACNDGLGR